MKGYSLMSTKFAQDLRQENRQKHNYIALGEREEIEELSKRLIKAIWTQHINTEISPVEIYKLVDIELRVHFKTPDRFRLGRGHLLRFVRSENLIRKEFNLTLYPEPLPPRRLWRAQPVKDLKWLLNGQELADLAELALLHWSKKDSYTVPEILGWSLFSAIVWGGLNDQYALEDFLAALIERRHIWCFAEDLHVIQLNATDKRFGSHFENDQLTRSYAFVIDDLTRCWLVRLQKESLEKITNPTIHTLLNAVLAQLNSTKRYDNKRPQAFLGAASYCWEQIQDVQIDQALVSVLNNRQQCCSLATPDFLRFFQPDLQKNPLRLEIKGLLKGNFPEKSAIKLKKSDIQVYADKAILEIRKILNDLKAKRISDAVPFLKLLIDHNNEGHTRLVAWIIDLVSAKNPRNKLRASSVIRYLDAVADGWLTSTYLHDIKNFEETHYEDIYKSMLELRKKGKDFYANRINRFHDFQIQKYKAPFVEIEYANEGQRCRAHIIAPIVYKAMCSALDTADGINQSDRRLFKLILILAYRTGLRREEIVGIQFSDIEWTKLSFIIRNNNSSKLKSDSANRRIPIWALLKPDELTLLDNFLIETKPKSKANWGRAIFAHSNSHHRLPSSLPYNLVITLLDNILKEYSYNFHSFRHTAISNLALILNAEPELVGLLTDYSPEECHQIRNALLGHEHRGQDRWFALAQFDGHLSPHMTLAKYVHFAHLMGGFAISKGKLDIPLAVFTNVTKYSLRRLARNSVGVTLKSKSDITLSKIRSILRSELSSISKDLQPEVPLQIPETKKEFCESLEPDHFDNSTFHLPGGAKSPISINAISDLLKQLVEEKPSHQSSNNFGIPANYANKFQERALELARRKTQRGEHRLKGVVPFRPTISEEQDLLAIFFENADKLHEKNSQGLHRFLDIFLTRVTTTVGGINFKLKDISEIKEFLLVGHQLVSVTNWRLKAPSMEDISKLKENLKSLEPNDPLFSIIRQSEELIKNPKLFDHLSVLESKAYNGYSLTIIAPQIEYMQKKNNQELNYSSGLLKYGCHMLAIADLSYILPD